MTKKELNKIKAVENKRIKLIEKEKQRKINFINWLNNKYNWDLDTSYIK